LTTTTDPNPLNDDTSEDTNVTTPGKDDTITKLTSSQNPSVHGQKVTFTATVTPATLPGPPTGSVTFKEGTTVLGMDTLDGAGQATFSTNALATGSHPITAVYSGDSNFNASNDSLNQVVNKADTMTAVTSSANPAAVGQTVTFTATVTAVAPGSGTPTGTITFKDGVTVLDTITVDGAGQAALISSNLTVGTHTITAEYSGSSNYNVSSGTVVPDQVVNEQFLIALPVVLKGPEHP
jgi:hypothetical protein